MTQAVTIFLAGVVMASTGQLLLKTAALRGRDRSLVRSFLNPFSMAGYLLMLSSTVTSTIALRTLPLRITVSLLPLGYVVVVIFSVVILRERMHRHHVWGMLMILAGVIIFNLRTL